MNQILIICGPTATGKTSLGLEIARRFQGEVVSADSRQIYQGMDVVTGKDIPRNSDLKTQNLQLGIKNLDYKVGYRLVDNIPVWLTDVCQPDQEFSVAHFVRFARLVIKDIWQRKKLPIVVGGTGLYIKCLFEPMETEGVAPDWELRKRLEKWSVDKLQKELRSLDPKRWEKMNRSDRNNTRRLIRAIEVAQASCQRPVDKRSKLDVRPFFIGLRTRNRKDLYKRIDQRVKERIEQGAEQEARELFKKYSKNNLMLTTTIGYKQWRAFLAGAITQKEVIERWQFAEHAYARRQMTWFKKQSQICWFEIDGQQFPQNVVKKVKQWYIGVNQALKDGKN